MLNSCNSFTYSIIYTPRTDIEAEIAGDKPQETAASVTGEDEDVEMRDVSATPTVAPAASPSPADLTVDTLTDAAAEILDSTTLTIDTQMQDQTTLISNADHAIALEPVDSSRIEC